MAARARLYASAAWHDVSRWRVYHSGAWRDVQRARVYATNPADNTVGWRDVYTAGGTPAPTPSPTPTPTPTPTPPVTLSVTPSVPSVFGSSSVTGNVTTGQVTVTATGGTSPYTYTFTMISYSSESSAPTINIGASPNIASFTQNMPVIPETETASFKCSVRDSKGNVGSCTISATWNTVVKVGTGGSGTSHYPGGSGGELP